MINPTGKILPSSGYGDNNLSADRTPTDEARAEQAQSYSIVPQDDLDNEFLDSNVAQSPGKSTEEVVLQVSCKHLSLASKAARVLVYYGDAIVAVRRRLYLTARIKSILWRVSNTFRRRVDRILDPSSRV